METTRLSSKGQVVIPKAVRTANDWRPGQELVVVDTGEGVLLRPKAAFDATDIRDVAGFLKYDGPPKSLEDMDDAIRRGVSEDRDGGR